MEGACFGRPAMNRVKSGGIPETLQKVIAKYQDLWLSSGSSSTARVVFKCGTPFLDRFLGVDFAFFSTMVLIKNWPLSIVS